MKDPVDALPSTSIVIANMISVVHESGDVGYGFKDHQSCCPAMKEVECVVANMEYSYEGIVPKSEQYCKYHVESCEGTASAPKLCKHLGSMLV